MIKQLINVLRSARIDQQVASDLRTMIGLSDEAIQQAGAVLFGAQLSDVEREGFYARDRRINALQQSIRTALVSQLPFSSTMHLARLLVLVSLIKDVERIGDEAKNLLEAAAMLDGPLPDDPIGTELGAIRESVEAALRVAGGVLDSSDRDRAKRLCEQGQAVSQRCERLLRTVQRSSHPAAVAVPIVLVARYYKRTQKHVMNLLSSVLVPLHKLDYFDGSQA